MDFCGVLGAVLDVRIMKSSMGWLLLLGWMVTFPVFAQEAPVSDAEALRRRARERALTFLAEKGLAEDGSFTRKVGAGITALAVTAALRNGRAVDDPLVAKGLQALESFVQPDGGIYGGDRLKNYETCVCVVTFAEANADGRYNKILENANKFLRGLQEGDQPGKESNDPWYGGVGYAGAGRPDLSNTTYFVEALQAIGAEDDDPAIQRALAFINRCQNLDGHGNDTRFAQLVNDGGFYYSIPVGNANQEYEQDSQRYTANGGLRSYGSMTYSGLKSMIYAGLDKDDPRVKAALEWIRQNYSVETNPGQGEAGLYYYYHTFGSAFHAADVDQFTDAQGNERNWRHDLIQALVQRQNADGSWTNSNRQWFENDPNLATSFALIALSYCRPAEAIND